jgi:hypothetical protein
MLDHNAILYSQHIPGSQNIIADTLSHDFHIETNELSSLIVSTFQVPMCFHITPLPDETVSWLTSLMLSSVRQQELKSAHTPSASWHGAVGRYTFSNSDFQAATLSSQNSMTTNGSSSSAHSCNLSAMATVRVEASQLKPAPAVRLSTTWLRNSSLIPTPTQD